jgi:hypothetical protein
MAIPPAPTRSAPPPPPIPTFDLSLDPKHFSTAREIEHEHENPLKGKSAHAILIGVLGVLCGTATLEMVLGPESDEAFSIENEKPKLKRMKRGEDEETGHGCWDGDGVCQY